MYTLDTRTWKVLNRWPCPVKHAPTGVSLSCGWAPGGASASNTGADAAQALCYASSLDNELVCGLLRGGGGKSLGKGRDFGSSIEHQVLRGDSRWIGFGHVPPPLASAAGAETVPCGARGDTVLGICESGSAYAVTHAEMLCSQLCRQARQS